MVGRRPPRRLAPPYGDLLRSVVGGSGLYSSSAQTLYTPIMVRLTERFTALESQPLHYWPIDIRYLRNDIQSASSRGPLALIEKRRCHHPPDGQLLVA